MGAVAARVFVRLPAARCVLEKPLHGTDHVVGAQRIEDVERVVGSGNLGVGDRGGLHGAKRRHELLGLGGGNHCIGRTVDHEERRRPGMDLIER